MNPEDIKTLAEGLSKTLSTEEASNGPIYVLISVLVTVSPFIFRYFRKTFVTSIENVMYVHVKQVEDLHSIMHMHIDELVHVKEKQNKIEDKHIELDKRVTVNETKIHSIKDRIKDKAS